MARYIQEGKRIDITNTTEETIFYGDVVKIGKRIGIAASNIDPSMIGALSVEGVYEISAKTEEFNVGDIVYFDEVEKKVTKTQNDVLAGWVIRDKKSQESVALVKIN